VGKGASRGLKMPKCIDCAHFEPNEVFYGYGYCSVEDIPLTFAGATADLPCPYYEPIDPELEEMPAGGQKLARCIDCRWCRYHSQHRLLFCYVFEKVLTRQQAMIYHQCDCYFKCPEYILQSRIVNGKLVFKLVRRGC